MAASSGGDLSGILCVAVFVLIPSAVWVWYDASRRPGMDRTWAIGVLVFWIVCFPVYLWERRKYPVTQRPPELPVAQSTLQLPAPGWYIDPQDTALLRWWDGSQWTEHRRSAEL